MKLFLIALVLIGCAVSFSNADDGWTAGYVAAYDELKAGLQALKANAQSDAAKQAAQEVYDNLGTFQNAMQQQNGQQVVETSWDLANSIMFDLASEMTGDPTFQDFLYNHVGVPIKQLRRQQFPYEPYAEALNKVIVDFKNGLNTFLGGGC